MNYPNLTQKSFTSSNAGKILKHYIATNKEIPQWAQVKIFEFENQDDFLLEYIKKGGEFY